MDEAFKKVLEEMDFGRKKIKYQRMDQNMINIQHIFVCNIFLPAFSANEARFANEEQIVSYNENEEGSFKEKDPLDKYLAV